jgi:hypothetical protein
MRYFVIGDDGQRYGPADVPTLNQWIQEGRVRQTTLLQPEAGGATVAASIIPDLSFAPQPGAPQTFASYQRPGNQMVGDDGKKDLMGAWIAGALSPILSFFCIFGLAAAIYGVQMGYRAKQKGQSSAVFAIALNVLGVLFWIGARFLFSSFRGTLLR